MDKGLKKGAIGYISNIVIGVASTAPAYSLAHDARRGRGWSRASGTHAPAVLLVAFLPMFLVAGAYKYFDRARPRRGHDLRLDDAGIRAERTGWMNGWACSWRTWWRWLRCGTVAGNTPSSSSASPNSANRKRRSSSRPSCCSHLDLVIMLAIASVAGEHDSPSDGAPQHSLCVLGDFRRDGLCRIDHAVDPF